VPVEARGFSGRRGFNQHFCEIDPIALGMKNLIRLFLNNIAKSLPCPLRYETINIVIKQ
jgi:hypothetical protein